MEMRNYQSWKEIEDVIRADAKKDETIEKSNHTDERCFITVYSYDGWCAYEANEKRVRKWHASVGVHGLNEPIHNYYSKPYHYAIRAYQKEYVDQFGKFVDGEDWCLRLTENEPTEEDVKGAVDHYLNSKGVTLKIDKTYVAKIEPKKEKLPVARFFFLPERAADNTWGQVSVFGKIAVFPNNKWEGFYNYLDDNFLPVLWTKVCDEWGEPRICKVNFKTTALAKRWIKSNSWVIAYNAHNVVCGERWHVTAHSHELKVHYLNSKCESKCWHFNRGVDEDGRQRIKQIVNEPYAAIAKKEIKKEVEICTKK